MKTIELKNGRKEHILESVKDILTIQSLYFGPLSSDLEYTVKNTSPLLQEILASKLNLHIGVTVDSKTEGSYRFKKYGHDYYHDCIGVLYHSDDLNTSVGFVGFNSSNDRYILRNKAIERGGDYREYSDSTLKESKHLKTIMTVLKNTYQKVVPTPITFLNAILHTIEKYRREQMAIFLDKHIKDVAIEEVRNMIMDNYIPVSDRFKDMMQNYRDHYDTYHQARQYSPMVYHVRRIPNTNDIYVSGLRYPNYDETHGTTHSTSSIMSKYLEQFPMKEKLVAKKDIPELFDTTMALLDLQHTSGNYSLTTATVDYPSNIISLPRTGIKLPYAQRYWIIDEDNKVNLNV